MKKFIIIGIIFVIIFSSNLIINNTITPEKPKKRVRVIPVPLKPAANKKTIGTMISQETLQKLKPKAQPEKPENYLQLNSLSSWWNTSWEYRINVTVSEPNSIARNNWPIDVRIDFSPPAYKYSIRVIEPIAGEWNEIPYQIWNITYVNSTHIQSATITFPVIINKGETKIYQVYWSINYKDPPAYSKALTLEEISIPTYGTKYRIKSTGTYGVEYSAEFVSNSYSKGGVLINITLPSGNSITQDIVHFAISRNPGLGYNLYKGDANILNPDYTVIIEETTDSLLNIYMGVMFITVKIINAKLRTKDDTDIAQVNITYRFYGWGILVEENIKWLQSDTATYYVAGWIFDQDLGQQHSTFNYVFTSSATYLGEDTTELFKDDMEASDTPTRWSTGSLDAALYGTGVNCWEWGIPTSGPNAAHSGQYLWATDLDGNYPNYAYCYLQSPSISLPSSGGLQINLSFWHWYEFEYYAGDGGYDGGWVEISTDGGQTWQQIDPIDGPAYRTDLLGYITYETDRAWLGSSNGWVKSVFNLTAYAGKTIMIRFVFFSDYSVTCAGWYIDDAYIILSETFPQISDYGEIINTNSVAFFHETLSNGIGATVIDEKSSGITVSTSNTIWHNEADESKDDYIFWARNLTNLQAGIGSIYNITYAVIPWLPSGTTTSERLSGFINVNTSIHNPLQYSLASIERYKILVKVRVSDAENLGIPGANVSFYSGGSLVYSALTNSSGYAVLDVIRQAYSIVVTIKSANASYDQSTSVDLSSVDYTQHTYLVTFTFSLYHVKIQALANMSGNIIKIQNGYFKFYTVDYTFCVAGYTDVNGWIDVYIEGGQWYFEFDDPSTASGCDNFTIYSDPDFTLKEYGPSDGNPLLISIQAGVVWYLRDHDTEALAIKYYATHLDVITIPSPVDVYWSDTFEVCVKLRLDNGTPIDGTIHWYIFNGSKVVDNYYGSGSTMDGWYNFTIDTDSLNAGTYTLYINASNLPSTATVKYLIPSPVEKAVTIRERITDLDATFSSTSIYWNEPLTLTVFYKDHLTASGISGATVEAIFICGETKATYSLTETNAGEYELEISNFIHPAGTYTVIIKAYKQNYEKLEKVYSITVNPRPTRLDYDSYVELSWQSSYTLAVKYQDTGYTPYIDISDANVEFEIRDSQGNIIVSNIMTWNGTHYVYQLDLTNIKEGVYRIEISASKDNYESASGVITFYLRLRRTSLTADNSKVTIVYGHNITVKFYYLDIDLEELPPIAGADYHSFTISIPGEKELVSGTLIDLNNGTYLLNINSSEIKRLGVFNVTVYLSKEHYEPRSISILVEIDPIPTEKSAETTTVTTEWGIPIDVIVNYTRKDGGGINNANATFVIKYGDEIKYKGKLDEIGDGMYRLYMNSSSIVNETNYVFGTYTIYIYLEKQFHENQTVVITWTIEPITTYCNPRELPVEIEWGMNVTITYTLWYYRNGEECPVVGATAILEIIEENKVIHRFNLIELEDGKYLLNLNVSTFINETHQRLGAYTLKIIFAKKYFTTFEAFVSLTVNPISTVASANPSNITLYWSEKTDVIIMYNRSRDKQFISDVTLEYNNMDGAISIETYRDKFVMHIDSSKLTEGTYLIEVNITKLFYENQTVVIMLKVEPIPTVLVWAKISSITLEWGEILDLNFTYIMWNNTPITDAIAQCNITGPTTYMMSLTPLGNGIYRLQINVSEIANSPNLLGTYKVTICIRKDHHVEQIATFSLTINPISTIATAYPTNITLYWSEKTSVVMLYNRSKDGKFVADASIEFDNLGGALQLSRYSDKFVLLIDSSKLTEGTYLIEVNISRAFYVNQTITIMLKVEPIPTVLVWAKISSITLEWGEILDLNFTYIMWNGTPIIQATIAKCSITGEIQYEVTLVSLRNGTYVLRVNTSDIATSPDMLGTYTVVILLEKTHFDEQRVTFALTINPISTADPAPSPQNVTLYWGEEANITIEWRQLRGYVRIADAMTNITVLVEGNPVSVSADAAIIVEYDGVYVLCVDSSKLEDNIMYEIMIEFEKPFYESKVCFVYVTVEPIPATAVLSTTELRITWGDDANVSLTIIDTYGNGVSNVEVIISDTIPLDAISVIELSGGNYTIFVRGGLLTAGANYTVYIEFEKEHYDIPPKRLLVIVKRVQVRVDVETATSAWKSISPFDYGKASSTLTIRVFELPMNIPLNITGIVLLNNETIGWINATVMISPGVYEIPISWDEIEPGIYELKIRIMMLKRGKYVGSWDIVAAPVIYINGARSDTLSTIVNVDFVSGHERIFGVAIPKIYFWGLVGLLLIGVGAGFVKFIMWWRLPVEVKELIKIIKDVKKGIYEYKVPPRREILAELIRKELGIE